jgi:hypothetical protein
MKILAIGRPATDSDVSQAIAQHAAAELHVLWTLYRDETVREMHSPGGPGIVLILEAASTEEARRALARFPLVAAGVITFEIIELHPFRALSLLFADADRH